MACRFSISCLKLAKNILDFGNITNHISNHFQFWDIAKKSMEQKIEAHKTTEKKFFASHRTTVYANTLTNTSILHIVAILYFIWCLRRKREKIEKVEDIFCLPQSKREYWSYLTQWQFVKLIERKVLRWINQDISYQYTWNFC